MTEPAARASRIFKTARFTRAARKAHIDIDELEHFRRLAHDSEQLTDKQLFQLLNDEDLNEICYGRAKV